MKTFLKNSKENLKKIDKNVSYVKKKWKLYSFSLNLLFFNNFSFSHSN